MRAVGRLVAEPMLHVHAGLRAFEDDLAVHDRWYDDKAGPPKLRMFT
jgi:hypothetical protein